MRLTHCLGGGGGVYMMICWWMPCRKREVSLYGKVMCSGVRCPLLGMLEVSSHVIVCNSVNYRHDMTYIYLTDTSDHISKSKCVQRYLISLRCYTLPF